MPLSCCLFQTIRMELDLFLLLAVKAQGPKTCSSIASLFSPGTGLSLFSVSLRSEAVFCLFLEEA